MKDDLEVTPTWGDSGDETLRGQRQPSTTQPRTSSASPAIELAPGAVLRERPEKRLESGTLLEILTDLQDVARGIEVRRRS